MNVVKEILDLKRKFERYAATFKGSGSGGGSPGPPGPPGADGDSAYVYIAYASSASGDSFTMTFDPLLDYIGILSTTAIIPSITASDFTGLWKNYGGSSSGSASGDSAYVYIAYASSDTGADFTITFDPLLDYIGILSTTAIIPSITASDFVGLWKNYKGTDGDSAYVYIGYASSTAGDSFTEIFDPLLDYIGIISVTSVISSITASDFTGKWKNYGGSSSGGGSGDSAYVYIGYASSTAGDGFTMTFDPLLDYIGILSTTAAILSITASDFAGLWKKYNIATIWSSTAIPDAGIGTDGDFWIKYVDTV